MKKHVMMAAVLSCLVTSACGGGGTATAPTRSYPAVAGAWNGRLIGATADASADVRLTIHQTSDVSGALQRIHGLWSATAGMQEMGGNFNGGLNTDGRMQFTLDAGSPQCNFFLDVRLSGNRIEGTFSSVGHIGCVPPAVSQQGRVELVRD